jgi:hypothetical protein
MGETIGVNVLKRAQNMEISSQFDGYSAVRIFVGTDDDWNAVIYEAGNTNGRTLEIKNPFGTQAMANNILADIQGYQYQPLSADNALLNPAAEMGDGVTVNGVYSGLFVRATKFGRLMASDIAAPTDEEIEHEFAVESASDRQYTRFVQQTKSMLRITNMAIEAEVSARTSADNAINATLAIHATDIQARVTKQSPAGQTSFGWNLTDSEWSVFSGSPSNKILTASASGLKVKGRIEADEGYIGGENGFVITANKIYKNISRFGGSQSSGVYIGTDGIQLGRNFMVDSAGNLEANSGTFNGTIYAGNIVSTGTHGYGGYFSGEGLYGGSVGTGQLSSYANGGIGSGYSAQTTWNNARNQNVGVDLVNATTLLCYNLTVSSSASIASMYYQGYGVGWLGFTDGDGNSHFVLGSY